MFLTKVGGVNPYLADLVAYYPLDSNSNDFSGNTHNGTDTSISYANAGLIGNSATFNGTTSKIVVPQSTDFDFSDAVSDIPFSMSFNLYITTNGNYTILGKNKNLADEGQYNIYCLDRYVYVLLWKLPNNGQYLGIKSNDQIPLSSFNNIIVTYDGSGVYTGLKIYLNGVLMTIVNFSAGTYTKMQIINEPLVIGHLQESSDFDLAGRLDELYIWKNIVRTSIEAADIYRKMISNTPLI